MEEEHFKKLVEEKMHLVWEIAKKCKEKEEYKDVPISILVGTGAKTLIEDIGSILSWSYDFPEALVISEIESDTEIAAFMHQLRILNDPAQKTQLCLRIVEQHCSYLEFVPNNLKTAKMCNVAVKQSGYALEYVPDELKTAKLCNVAVKKCGIMLQFVPKKLRTAELCKAAVKQEQDAAALQFVPEKLKTAKFCLEAIKHWDFWPKGINYNFGEPLSLWERDYIRDAFEHVLKKFKTPEFCLEAAKRNGCIIVFLPKKLKTAELCKAAVKQNGYALCYVPEKFKTYEICLMAVKQKGYSFQFVPEKLKTAKLWLEAVKKEYEYLITRVPEEFKTANFWLELVKSDAWLLTGTDVPEEFKTLDMYIAAVKQEYWMFMLVPESLKEQVIKATGIQGGIAGHISAQEKEIFEKEVERICIKLTKFCEFARREGILALGDHIDKEQVSKKAILETGVKMAVDGNKGKIIEKYMDSWIEANCVKYYEKLLGSIIKTGVFCVQRGDNPKVAEYKMTALIPRELIPDTLLPESEKYYRRKMNTFTDPRDGKVYKTVKIGNQVWLAENLAYAAEGSKCYDDDESNGQKYGRLYDWETAMKACPKGWHLPSIDEVETLIVFADGDEIAMDKLKARSGWEFEENGTDNYGFAAMPGGFGRADGSFTLAGSAGGWWIAKKRDADRAYNWGISSLDIEVKRSADKSSHLFSVRCIQDHDPKNTFTDPRDGKVYKTVKIGEQVWMAENLAYAAEGSGCYDAKYGRLYHWDTAMKSCPDGWHLPSAEEWQTLFDFVGGRKIAGKKLKATSGWDERDGKSGDGTDEFGFAALPGGYGDSDPDSNKWFPSSEGYYGEWWTSDFEEFDGVVRGVIRYMECTSGRIGRSVALNQFKMFSVRCVKDNKSKEQGGQNEKKES